MKVQVSVSKLVNVVSRKKVSYKIKQLSMYFLAFIGLSQAFSIQAQTQVPPAHFYDTVKYYYANALMQTNRKFNCMRDTSKVAPVRALGEIAFDTLFKPILSNVFVGNNDLIQDGTAASFTQDATKGTLSINYAQFLNSKKTRLLNLGAFSKASDGLLGIYRTGSWSSEVGFNIGISFIHFKSRYFDTEKCLALAEKRQQYYIQLFSNWDSIMVADTQDWESLKNSSRLTLNQIYENTNPGTLWAAIVNRNSSNTLRDLKSYDSMLALLKTFKPPSDSLRLMGFYLNKLELALSTFEIKNDIFHGYNVWWTNIGISTSNNVMTASIDSLNPLEKKAYKPKNILKASLSIATNWITSTKNRLSFLKIGVDISLRNYLDHPFVRKPFMRFDSSILQNKLYNDNEDFLGSYNDLKPNILTLDPNVYFSWFFAPFKKRFGLDARIDAKITAARPGAISKEMYPSTFSAVIGPVFRFKQDTDISKGSVGVEVGIIDGAFKQNVWDYFGARLRVGVPFTAFIN